VACPRSRRRRGRDSRSWSRHWGSPVAAEIPLVVVDVMRVGPSTGIPTKSEAGDLNIAVHGLHATRRTSCWRPTRRGLPRHHAVGGAARRETGRCRDRADGPVLGQARACRGPAGADRRGRRSGRRRGRDDRLPPLRRHAGRGFRRWRFRVPPASPTPPTVSSTRNAHALFAGGRSLRAARQAPAQAHGLRVRRTLGRPSRANPGSEPGGHNLRSCTGAVREGLALAAADGIAARLVSLRLLAADARDPARRRPAGRALRAGRRAESLRPAVRYLRAECDLPGAVSSLHRPGALQFSPGEIHRHLVEWSRA